MTYQELKQLLAKMLPSKLTFYTNPSTKVSTLFWNNNDPRFVESVQDTELLSLCRMVEETLEKCEQAMYTNYIQYMIAEKRRCHMELVSYFDIAHASWEQRTQGLAKMKGLI